MKGFVTYRGGKSVNATVERAIEEIQALGLTLFARVDHAAMAEDAGLALRPTQLLIFGNPRLGTPLMNMLPTAAIDLPLKLLIWAGEDGVRVGYNDPAWIGARHGGGRSAPVGGMADALAAITAASAG